MDFVYIWRDQGHASQKELTHSLRSIEKNYTGDEYRVFIVGDAPPGIGAYTHIPMQRIVTRHLPNCLDACRKMEAILACPHINEEFTLMYDDVYLMRPVDDEFLRQRFALLEYDLNQRGTQVRKHKRLQHWTHDALLDAGHKRVWNYETHIPRVLEKRKMGQVFERYNPKQKRLLYFTLYFNHHFPELEPTILSKLDNVKAGFYGFNDQYGFGPPSGGGTQQAIDHYTKACLGKAYVNHNNEGLHVGLTTFICRAFANPSMFENSNKVFRWTPPEIGE